MTGQAEVQSWLWLFPATYVVHIAEESLAGERFYRWLQRVPLVRTLGLEISGRVFVVLNLIYLAAMVAAVWAAQRAGQTWIVPALGILVALNGVGHLVGSLATRSYSPGLVSGLLLWAPLGAWALVGTAGYLAPEEFWGGVAAGLLAQALVAASAVAAGRRPGSAGGRA